MHFLMTSGGVQCEKCASRYMNQVVEEVEGPAVCERCGKE